MNNTRNYRRNRKSRKAARRNAIINRVSIIFMVVALGLMFYKVAFADIDKYAVEVHYDHKNETYKPEETATDMIYIQNEEPQELHVDYNITSADSETKQVSWTQEDREYLIKVLTGECQNMSYENQLKYGSVVLNRVASDKYPDTIKEVVLDKHHGIQYACAYDGNMHRNPTETTVKVAEYLLENGSIYPKNVIYQSEFKQGSGVYEHVGNTYFCYA